MEQAAQAGTLQIILLFLFLIPVILFVLTQQRTLELIRPALRRMKPGQVWLQLIPLFGIVWQFIVIGRIADSIRDELNTPVDDSVFADEAFSGEARPTFNIGVSYAAMFCISAFMPGLIKSVFAFGGMIAWIIYWAQLARYKKRLKERSLLSNRSS